MHKVQLMMAATGKTVKLLTPAKYPTRQSQAMSPYLHTCHTTNKSHQTTLTSALSCANNPQQRVKLFPIRDHSDFIKQDGANTTWNRQNDHCA